MLGKNSEIKYKGKMFEIVTFEAKPGIDYEVAVRSPGVRLLIEHKRGDEVGLLMTKEIRRGRDQNILDYRLPGGKVFENLEEFNKAKENNIDISECALNAAKLEAEQEAGIHGGDFTTIGIARAGGSVEWDLYYFHVVNAIVDKQDLSEEEKMDNLEVVFLSVKEVFEKLKNKEINEGRSADVLWRWLVDNKFLAFI